MTDISLLAIFFTGLTTGGFTCLALQGGLLTSVIAQTEDKFKNGKITATAAFLIGKIISHTLFGFALGFLGSVITLSPILRGWLQIFIGIYLFGIAGNLLNLHPFFRYFVFTPPKFLVRLTRNEAHRQSIFAPLFLGLFTVFIPCAVTQATEVIALGTGNPFYGALIMLAFTLGTTPTFIAFGVLLNSTAEILQKYFPVIAGVALFVMSLWSINNGIGLTGSVYTFQNFYQAAVHPQSQTEAMGIIIENGSQIISIGVTNSGYTPQVITLKKDIPVRLTLHTQDVQNCSRAFTIPSLNLQKLLPETGTAVVEFTPHELGPLAFSCSMGMYTGRFNVIN